MIIEPNMNDKLINRIILKILSILGDVLSSCLI